jgi:DNA-binding NarL/FixJ family response regulator
MKPITVLIADDHGLVRDGLRELLNREEDIRVVGEAGNGHEALRKIKSLQPDILLLDIMMPRLNGLETIRLIHDASIKTKIIVLSMHQKRPYIRESLKFGALGYILKTSPGAELIEAVRTVHRGEFYFSHCINADIINGFLQKKEDDCVHEDYDLLTQREQQIFRLIAEGNSVHEIADILCISPKTVEKHRGNLSRKLNLHDPVSMLKYGVKIGIIDTDDWLD